jgi:hypothetical protein
MSNHAHFLFLSGPADIVKLMRRLLTGYAISFNRRCKRHGQLFQNTVQKSIVCREDTYLKELVRSLVGWAAVKKRRKQGMDWIKGDQRILGESDIVLSTTVQQSISLRVQLLSTLWICVTLDQFREGLGCRRLLITRCRSFDGVGLSSQ